MNDLSESQVEACANDFSRVQSLQERWFCSQPQQTCYDDLLESIDVQVYKLNEKQDKSLQSAIGFVCTEQNTSLGNKQAIKQYESAARKNDMEAHCQLGYIYLEGIHGVCKDIDKSLYHYKIASELGSIDATYNVGCILLNEVDSNEQDLILEYFTKGVKENHCGSILALGLLYKEGVNGCIQSDVEAAKQFARGCELPANAFTSRILVEYATCLLRGEGVPCNCSKGLELLKQALESNEEEIYETILYILDDITQTSDEDIENANKLRQILRKTDLYNNTPMLYASPSSNSNTLSIVSTPSSHKQLISLIPKKYSSKIEKPEELLKRLEKLVSELDSENSNIITNNTDNNNKNICNITPETKKNLPCVKSLISKYDYKTYIKQQQTMKVVKINKSTNNTVSYGIYVDDNTDKSIPILSTVCSTTPIYLGTIVSVKPNKIAYKTFNYDSIDDTNSAINLHRSIIQHCKPNICNNLDKEMPKSPLSTTATSTTTFAPTTPTPVTTTATTSTTSTISTTTNNNNSNYYYYNKNWNNSEYKINTDEKTKCNRNSCQSPISSSSRLAVFSPKEFLIPILSADTCNISSSRVSINKSEINTITRNSTNTPQVDDAPILHYPPNRKSLIKSSSNNSINSSSNSFKSSRYKPFNSFLYMMESQSAHIASRLPLLHSFLDMSNKDISFSDTSSQELVSNCVSLSEIIPDACLNIHDGMYRFRLRIPPRCEAL